MKMKKLDMSGVKNYLFQKGERVGLLVCAVIAGLLVGLGIMKAGGAGTPWAENIKKMREPLERQINVPAKVDTVVKTPDIPPQWAFQQSNFQWAPLAPLADAPDNLRRNPTILKIMDDPKHLQVDVVVGGYFAHELERGEKVVAFGEANKNAPMRNPTRKGAGGGTDNLTKIMKPGRMVIVSAVFPMQKQFEEYQRQLHYATLAALLADPDYVPQPLGITVYRREVKVGVETTWDPKPVYRYNAKEDKADVDDRIDKFFREALIDEDNPKALGDHVVSGLVTPLPELANKEYRPLKLQGIHINESLVTKDKGTGIGRWTSKRPAAGNVLFQRNGRNQGPVDNTRNHTSISWKDLDPATRDKFMGKIDFFDPTGSFDAMTDPRSVTNPSQTTPGKRSRRGVPRAPAEPGAKIEIKDALVRFIDVGVEPGKTYQYTFCIHMANPNYEKKDLVAYQELAKDKELLSPFAYSPFVTIPGEYFYYAHDEQISALIERGSDSKPAMAGPPLPYGRWNTAIQIHKWEGTISGVNPWTVADWAIAERLLTRRGDVIGREVTVEVPIWDKDAGENGSFEIGFQPQPNKGRNQPQSQSGIRISFVRGAHPPLLVDFEGGKKSMRKVGATNFPKDESAVEILVLTPDNKLILRNSRDDADPDNPAAADRQARVDTWKQELKSLRKNNTTNARPVGQVPGRAP